MQNVLQIKNKIDLKVYSSKSILYCRILCIYLNLLIYFITIVYSMFFNLNVVNK